MKTSLQELIEYIEEWQPKNKFTDPIWHKAKSLLETEKQQIIDAYETKIKTYINEYGNIDIKSGELFYKETFETNKETLKQIGMIHSIILNNGIITFADTDFKCPKCECVHTENDYYSKLYKSDDCFVYQNCKGCKEKLGISTNIKGDVVVWIKKDEIQSHPY